MKRVDTSETISLGDNDVKITVVIGNRMIGSSKIWVDNILQEPTERTNETIIWKISNSIVKNKVAEIYSEIRDTNQSIDLTAIKYIIEFGVEISKTEKTELSDGDTTSVDYFHTINFK